MNRPLVSIIVITYNSSKYVINTLESAKLQTYDNIELIISDDFSHDGTIEIIKKWVENNKLYFKRIELITSDKNTGIPANCNRGFKVARGEWIKFIAGDDILLNNCISDNLFFCSKYKKAKFVFSLMEVFSDEKKHYNAIKERNKYFQYEAKSYYELDVSEQKKVLLNTNFCSAPTAFIHGMSLNKLGMFDERIRGMEDYPLWLKATIHGYKMYFHNKITVKYRYGSSSAGLLYNESMKKMFYLYKFKELLKSNPKKAFYQLIYYALNRNPL